MVLTNTSEKNEVNDPIPGLLYQRGIGLFIDQLSISCESGSGRVIRKAETTPGWTQPYFYILPSDFFYIDYFTVMKVPCKQQVINKMHIDCLTIQFNANYFVLCFVHVAKSLQLCPTLCDPVDCSPRGSSVHGIYPGKNTGVGCHSLLQGVFPTQGLNSPLLCLLHWQAASLTPARPGKPMLCTCKLYDMM